MVLSVLLDIMDATSVVRLLAKIDTVNGYAFLSKPGLGHGHSNDTNHKIEGMFGCSVQADQSKSMYESITDMQERYMKDMYQESILELEVV